MPLNLSGLASAGDFSLQLSMGEIHVRTITGTWLSELQSVVDSDISDDEFVRLALRRAARTEKRPPKEAVDAKDDPEAGGAIAEAATDEDLQLAAEQLAKHNGWMVRGPTKGEALTKKEDETNASYFRRAIRYRRDKTKVMLSAFTSSTDRAMSDMLDRNRTLFKQMELHQDAMRPQVELANSIRNAADSLPRLQEHVSNQFEVIEQILKNMQATTVQVIGELQQGYKTATLLGLAAIVFAAATVAVAIWAPFKTEHDLLDAQRAMIDAANGLKGELRNLNEELRGMRTDSNVKPVERELKVLTEAVKGLRDDMKTKALPTPSPASKP